MELFTFTMQNYNYIHEIIHLSAPYYNIYDYMGNTDLAFTHCLSPKNIIQLPPFLLLIAWGRA